MKARGIALVGLLAALPGCVRAGYGVDAATDAAGVRLTDAREERAPHDGSRATVQGTVAIKTSVFLSCGSSSASDCKGTLFVGLYRQALPPFSGFVAGTSVVDADLSGSNTVSFAIHEVPSGAYSTWAFLAEMGALPTPPTPTKGDPATVLPAATTVPSSGVVNLQLTFVGRWLAN
jgi:hypothetical protein